MITHRVGDRNQEGGSLVAQRVPDKEPQAVQVLCACACHQKEDGGFAACSGHRALCSRLLRLWQNLELGLPCSNRVVSFIKAIDLSHQARWLNFIFAGAHFAYIPPSSAVCRTTPSAFIESAADAMAGDDRCLGCISRLVLADRWKLRVRMKHVLGGAGNGKTRCIIHQAMIVLSHIRDQWHSISTTEQAHQGPDN